MNFLYGKEEMDYLSKRDNKMEVAIKLLGKIERTTEPDLFLATVQNIVAQQISNKAFESVWNKFQNYFQDITPQKINSATSEDIKKLGVSLKKAEYIKNIAEKIINKELDLDMIQKMPDEEAINELVKLNGVGRWTAQMLLLFSMGRKNILSFGDFAIRKGLQNLHNHKEITKTIFEKYRKLYSPYCSVASIYLWEIGNMDLKIHSIASFVDKDDFLASYASPIGKIILSSDGENLTGLFFADIDCEEDNLKIFDETKKYLDAYFNNEPFLKIPKIKFRGADFQIRVWRELLKIPYGKTTTYKELAKILNTSPRAVGVAVGKNPIAIIAPCHRVLGANNKLTGYAWGLDIKEKLLKLEKNACEK